MGVAGSGGENALSCLMAKGQAQKGGFAISLMFSERRPFIILGPPEIYFGRIFRARIPSARNVPEIYFGRFKGNLYVIRANSGAFRAKSGEIGHISGDFGRITSILCVLGSMPPV